MYNILQKATGEGRKLMHSVKLAVADGDPISLRRCVDELSGKRGIHIVACTADGAELIEAVRETRPDVVVTGLTLKRVDGFGVLEAIRMMSGSRPISLVLSKMNKDCVIDLATKLGADYYLVKPINGDLLYRRICQLADLRCENPLESADADLRPVAAALREMGISPAMKGYGYLLAASRLCGGNAELLSGLTVRLYPEIARQNGVAPHCVERAIRTAIQSAWEDGGFVRYAAETGDERLAMERMSAGEMIRHLTRIYMEGASVRVN